MESPIVTLHQLGYLLQEIRGQRGLTQRQLGLRAGFGQSAISALESNPGSAKMERIFQLLAALDLEIVLRERKHHLAEHEW
ncbi:MAG: helix-turn-helix transcriptional regulator [Candidatus Eremiobacteraeota bacterium]|nr:helix-turn-helix transcriptional regulator [Candidatus Eremiobacteraeota bacterium]MCW5868939.1 helix-turn-helix transcriptional regulator [Candidatus Eremiobacteraeota bacterium]